MKKQKSEVRGLLYGGRGLRRKSAGTVFAVIAPDVAIDQVEALLDPSARVEAVNEVGYHDITVNIFHGQEGLTPHRVIAGIFVPQNPCSERVDLKDVANDLRWRFGQGSMLVKPKPKKEDPFAALRGLDIDSLITSIFG